MVHSNQVEGPVRNQGGCAGSASVSLLSNFESHLYHLIDSDCSARSQHCNQYNSIAAPTNESHIRTKSDINHSLINHQGSGTARRHETSQKGSLRGGRSVPQSTGSGESGTGAALSRAFLSKIKQSCDELRQSQLLQSFCHPSCSKSSNHPQSPTAGSTPFPFDSIHRSF